MATQQQAPQENKKPEPATPAAIGAASVEIAAALAKFSADEQGRIIRAAATINGLKVNGGQQQRGR